MTRAARAGAVEIGPACFRISGQHVDRRPCVSIRRNRLDSLMQEMREIDDLPFGELGLMRARRLDRGPDAVPEPIAQDDSGSNEVGTAIGSFPRAAMTIDALLRVDRAAAYRRSLVDLLTFVRTGLRR